MYCRNCGTENRNDAKYCKKCGAELTGQPNPSNENGKRRIGLIIPVIAVAILLAVGACVFAFQWARSRAVDAEYEDYLSVHESIQGIETSYRNQSGYHDPERIPDLLDDVESYGLENTALITSVDRGDDYVEFQLSDGTFYVFMPSMEGMLAGDDECSIVTFEPWWTDVKGVDSLRLDGDDLEIEGFTEVSGFDMWAHAVSEAIDEYVFDPNDNVNDSNVTIDRLRMIGDNQFVFYFGHGGAPTKSHGSSLTTGEETTKESRKRYRDDLKASRLVQMSSGRLGVTDKFFDSDNFGDNAFSNTDIFLLACHSCQDTKLADALIGRGARTVTGFTESVTVNYGIEMVYGILGLNDDAKGLTDVGKDGKYLTFAESISNAQAVYGSSDPYVEFKWYEAKHEPAKAVCYPVESAKGERLSETLVAYLDGDKDTAVEFIREWYNDWTFENGRVVKNAQSTMLRCAPFFAENSKLLDEFMESCSSYTGEYSRDVAASVVSSPSAEELDGGAFRVTVRYVGINGTVDQDGYDRLLADPSEDVWDVTVGGDGKISSLTRVGSAQGDAQHTYHLDGFDFVLPGAWKDKVEVVDGKDSTNGWLQVVVPGSTHPILQITGIGSTYSEYGETYDTKTYFQERVEMTGGIETARADGETLLIYSNQRPERDGCLVGPSGASVLLEPSVMEFGSDAKPYIDDERAGLISLLIGNTDGMDAKALDEALIQRMAEQIIFTDMSASEDTPAVFQEVLGRDFGSIHSHQGYTEDSSHYYSLEDLDGNGNPELIVSYGMKNNDQRSVCSIWGIDTADKAICLLDHAYRGGMKVLSNGTIWESSSSSAFDSHCWIWRIEGASAVKVVSIDHDGTVDNQDVETLYTNLDEGISEQLVDESFFSDYTHSLEVREDFDWREM